jgi:8-oxo-dGTP diphosphatase
VAPGVPGLSEHIRVRSIVGRYLEHSRILRFGEAPGAAYYLGSADMMPRNLSRRVEVVAPIEDPGLCLRLEEILQVCLADDTLAWDLGPTGTWSKVPTTRGLGTHRRLQELGLERARGAAPDPARATTVSGVVVASGGVVARRGEAGHLEVLLVHRPAYDDWSFPKGKALDGEPVADAALREVLEETGYRCSAGPELATLDYLDRNGSRKLVRYWAMTVTGGEFAPNAEVDEIRWLTSEGALHLLSYDRDRAVLRSFMAGKRP